MNEQELTAIPSKTQIRLPRMMFGEGKGGDYLLGPETRCGSLAAWAGLGQETWKSQHFHTPSSIQQTYLPGFVDALANINTFKSL